MDLRPIDRIRQVQEPLLLIQGDQDRNTTLAQAERLFAAAPGPDKRLWVVRGAGHQDLYQFAPQEYQTRVTALLSRSLRATAPTPVTSQPTPNPIPTRQRPDGLLAQTARVPGRRPGSRHHATDQQCEQAQTTARTIEQRPVTDVLNCLMSA